MSEMSFEQMLEESLKTIRNGEVVEGTVIDVKPDEIILNMWSSFRATISTKWTTTRCLNIIRKRMPLVQLR